MSPLTFYHPVLSLDLSPIHLFLSPPLPSCVWGGPDGTLRHRALSWLATELLQGAGLRVADPRERGEAHRAGRADVSVSVVRTESWIRLKDCDFSFNIWPSVSTKTVFSAQFLFFNSHNFPQKRDSFWVWRGPDWTWEAWEGGNWMLH